MKKILPFALSIISGFCLSPSVYFGSCFPGKNMCFFFVCVCVFWGARFATFIRKMICIMLPFCHRQFKVI